MTDELANDEFTLTLKRDHILAIGTALQELQFKFSAPVIDIINRQLAAQGGLNRGMQAPLPQGVQPANQPPPPPQGNASATKPARRPTGDMHG